MDLVEPTDVYNYPLVIVNTVIYGVKEAGAASAAATYGAGALNGLRDAAHWLFRSHPLPEGGYGPGVINKVKGFGHGASDLLREGFIGSPVNVAQELRRPGGLGHMYKNFFNPHGSMPEKAMNALSLGLPAYDIYRAATSGPEHRGENIARSAASLGMLPLTYRLGVPGQLLLHQPVTNLAARVGKLFDRPTPPPQPPQSMPYNLDGVTS